MVGDADFLWFLTKECKEREANIEKVRKLGGRAILTPNIVEFERLVNSVLG